MWMKHDANNENNAGRFNELGLLKCPMCKGRGYFEPTDVLNTKSSDCFPNEEHLQNSVKLPTLQTKVSNKQVPKPRSKYSLPSINNVKNLPEHRYVDLTGYNGNYPDISQQKEMLPKTNTDEHGKMLPNKAESQIKIEASQKMSITSPVDSISDKLMPSPRTPHNPVETLKTSLSKLRTNNWNEAIKALREIVQLSRFQPQLLENSMVLIHRGLIFLLKSFRSVVVRTACQAANELFAAMANTQRPEFDELVSMLLQKTADTNKAVRQDANEALDTMVINIQPIHSVRIITLKGMTHKSALVRSTSARLLVCAVGVVGIETIYNGNKETRGRILNAAATCIQDGCQEVRNFGKRLIKMLMQHDDFDDVLQAEVNEILLKRIEKTLITIKYRS